MTKEKKLKKKKKKMKKEGQETNKLHTNLLVSRSSTEKDFSRSLFLRKKNKKRIKRKT